MPQIIPATRPRMSSAELMPKVKALGLDPAKDPVFVVGVRGYYRDTMGAVGENDRGIYDDAIFLVSPSFFASYNGNTDPSKVRRGRGRGAAKGMARLNAGLWRAHRFGKHKQKYTALCQLGGPVTVTRDGVDGDYPDTGNFGINIHNGSWGGTSSLGCQTIYPAQWQSFITSAVSEAKRYHGDRWDRTTIPYVLIDA